MSVAPRGESSLSGRRSFAPARALFSLLLLLYPRLHQRRFSGEMRDVFEARCIDVRGHQGRFGVVRLWARTFPQLARLALLERTEGWRSGNQSVPLGEEQAMPSRRFGDSRQGHDKLPPLPRKGPNPMDRLGQDFRYGFRSLARSPGFTAVAVLTLGIGIGINTAVFSLVNAMLLRPLPHVEDPARLAVMFGSDGGGMGVASYMDYLDFRDRTRAFGGFAAHKPLSMDLTTDNSTERIDGMIVTAEYFSVLGVAPAVGRFFVPEDNDEVGAETVVVLGHDFWQSAFAGDREVVGKTVVRQGLVLVLLGGIVGFAGAAASASLLSSLLFGISGFDATTYVGVIAILIVAAFAASYVPARRATRVDPITALRAD